MRMCSSRPAASQGSYVIHPRAHPGHAMKVIKVVTMPLLQMRARIMRQTTTFRPMTCHTWNRINIWKAPMALFSVEETSGCRTVIQVCAFFTDLFAVLLVHNRGSSLHPELACRPFGRKVLARTASNILSSRAKPHWCFETV